MPKNIRTHQQNLVPHGPQIFLDLTTHRGDCSKVLPTSSWGAASTDGSISQTIAFSHQLRPSMWDSLWDQLRSIKINSRQLRSIKHCRLDSFPTSRLLGGKWHQHRKDLSFAPRARCQTPGKSSNSMGESWKFINVLGPLRWICPKIEYPKIQWYHNFAHSNFYCGLCKFNMAVEIGPFYLCLTD